MTKTPSSLQDPSQGIYGQGKTEEVGEAWSRCWAKLGSKALLTGDVP
jgi:hypothetical protein